MTGMMGFDPCQRKTCRCTMQYICTYREKMFKVNI